MLASFTKFEIFFLSLAWGLPGKIAQYLLVTLMESKNKRSKFECCAELLRLVQDHGYRVVGRKGLHRIAQQISGDDPELRRCALDVMEAVLEEVDGEQTAVWELLGERLDGKAKGIIEERFKHAVRQQAQ